jgi:quercetin dioxygenase-like cupin family protein
MQPRIRARGVFTDVRLRLMGELEEKAFVHGDAILRAPGEGTTVMNPTGGPLTFKLTGAESDGGLTMFETVAAAGEGPPLHTHANEDEVLYFLEGAFRVKVDDQTHDAPAGSVLFVPRGVAHTWQNVGREPARFLVIFSPAAPGMEAFFMRFAQAPGAGIKEAFATLGADAGMSVLGPPLAESDPAPAH